MQTAVYSVLHDQAARHRTRPRDRAVGRCGPWREDFGRQQIRRRDDIPYGATGVTRVLIVDDDQSTLASLSRAFRLAGYETVVCDTAARAIALLKNDRFDLALSDVVMPGRDGLSMLEDLRDAGIATPVIMISGQATVDMAVRRPYPPAARFFPKPSSSRQTFVAGANAPRLVWAV